MSELCDSVDAVLSLTRSLMLEGKRSVGLVRLLSITYIVSDVC